MGFEEKIKISKKMKKYLTFNNLTQVCIVLFTFTGFLLTALKLPKWGLLSNLLSQPFWLYSSYKSWKEADQLGLFITTIMIILVLLFGVINYWFI
jgi:hypothetical protein